MIMRERHAMPDDVLATLKSENVLADFEARPAYQQNDYVGWITRAARDETRHSGVWRQVDCDVMNHPASAKD